MVTIPKQAIRIGTLVDANAPDPVAYIREILPHGFESFQLTFGAGIASGDLPSLAEDIRQTLEPHGAVIGALGVYGNPLLDNERAEHTRQSWTALIENAHYFDTNIIGGFTGRLTDVPIPDNMERFKSVFEPICGLAEERGVRIAFENCAMGGDWNRGDWNIAHGPDAWSLMFEALHAYRIGLEWEPCHQMVNLIDPLPQLREWVDRIFHVHGKCATIHWDVIESTGIHGSTPFAYHRTPGFGDTDWTTIISDLRGGGFEGSIDIEGWHDPVYRGPLEMTGQVHALNYLKACRGGDPIPNPG